MDQLTLNANLSQYAEVIVKVGLNLRPSQKLLIRTFGPVECVAPLVRQVTRSAYRAGASLVETIWSDEIIDRIRLEEAPLESFTELAGWKIDAAVSTAKEDDAYLTIYATDPDANVGLDTEKISIIRKTIGQKGEAFTHLMSSMAFNWSIVGAANPKWAAKIFPEVEESQQMGCLWEAIFDFARVSHSDPIAAWQTHIESLQQRQTYLNDKRYRALHFKDDGTDLRVGLVNDHVWLSGANKSKTGHPFVINLPTEEVFTMPQADEVDGTVRSSMPLNLGGTMINDFVFSFKDGQVSRFDAAAGQEALASLLETDAGAKRLGEVALVPQSSPIAKRGRLFYHTLFDENASNHLALGRAYPSTLKHGESLSSESLAQAGANLSMIHIDFMVGSATMAVLGETSQGKLEPVMHRGEWVI